MNGLLIFLVAALTVAPPLSRYYWPQNLATYAANGTPHTHIQIEGYVTYKATMSDGDFHIRLCDNPFMTRMNREHCVVCETIPALSLARPPLHARIWVHGISRFDAAHRWREVHPIEAWGTMQ